MAFNDYILINGDVLPMPETYSIDIEDIISASSGETEAGTVQRDIVRNSVHSISLSFILSAKWLKKMSEYRNLPKLNVKFFSPYTLVLTEALMYIDSFKVSLLKDSSKKGLWQLSFNLKEF